MPELPKYHLSEHRADTLLRPLERELGVLETRVKHYLDRLYMAAEDRAAVEAAYAALGVAHAEVMRRVETRAAVPQQRAQGGE